MCEGFRILCVLSLNCILGTIVIIVIKVSMISCSSRSNGPMLTRSWLCWVLYREFKTLFVWHRAHFVDKSVIVMSFYHWYTCVHQPFSVSTRLQHPNQASKRGNSYKHKYENIQENYLDHNSQMCIWKVLNNVWKKSCIYGWWITVYIKFI